MSKELVIGLDLGTTHCKAVAVSGEGQVAAAATGSYPLLTDKTGHVEQSLAEVWGCAVKTLDQLVRQVDPGRVEAIALGGAMHSLAPVSEDGAPLAMAMTWADNRSVAQARALREGIDRQQLYERTGCPLVRTYNIARLRWWQEEATEIAEKAAFYVAIKDWVLFRLTGLWVTDHSLASTTGLLDLRERVWDREALELAGITADQLPELMPPQAVVGSVTAAAASETGLPGGLPVVAGGNDGCLANLGAGAATPGSLAITIGTSGAVRIVSDQPHLDAKQRTWCYVFSDDRWLLGGAINNGGLALQWVRERFYRHLPEKLAFAQMNLDAAEAPPGAEGLLIAPYFSGERSPHWDPMATAAMRGLTLRHERAHLVRAVMEGVAFCLADVLEALRDQMECPPVARLTGTVAHNELWTQILADVLGLRLEPVEVADASALGAALLGHWAIGHLPTLDHLPEVGTRGQVIEPDPGRHQFYRIRHQAFQRMAREMALSRE